MMYEVRSEPAEARRLASIRSTTARRELGAEIIRLLDVIWPAVREQGVRTGHNVVVYHGAGRGVLAIEVGVETFTEFAERGAVGTGSTPEGEVATTAHFGEYSEMAGAYAALERWCVAHGRTPSGVSWEVYGDWEDDPTRRRTDIHVLLEPAGPTGP